MEMKHEKTINPLNGQCHAKSGEILLFNSYHMKEAFSKALYVCQSGMKKWTAPGWDSGSALYNHYILCYLSQGEGVYCCNNRKYRLRAGSMFLIPPNSEAVCRADSDNPCQYYWVGFNGIESRELLQRSGLGESNLAVWCDSSRQEAVAGIMDQIAGIRTHSLASQLTLVGLLYQLFGEIVQNDDQISRSSLRYYYDAVAFIWQNAENTEITARDVAAHIGVERSHLYRIFKENGQYSVKQIITETRMKKAKLSLTNTDKNKPSKAVWGTPKNTDSADIFGAVINSVILRQITLI